MSDTEHKMTQEQIDASIDCAARVLKLDGIDIYAKPGEPGVVDEIMGLPVVNQEFETQLDGEMVLGSLSADDGQLVLPEGFENLPPEMLHIEDQEFKPAE